MIDASKLPEEQESPIRVAVLGNVSAGKSTLLGVLKSGELDNARGSSRQLVMKHRHEIETGRTTSPISHLVAFDEHGSILKGSTTPNEATRVIRVLDVAGHEQYFKNTIQGIAQGMIDYTLVLVSAGQEPNHMTVHHLNLATALGIPTAIVISKIDGCPYEALNRTKRQVAQLVKSASVGTSPFVIRSEKDIDTVSFKMDSLVPILFVSSVTGEGLSLLGKLLVSLPKRRRHTKKLKRPFEFLVEEVFNVRGIGPVVSGFVNAGTWKKGETVHVGPLSDGSYIETAVKSVHVERKEVDCVSAGHSACFALSLSKENRKRLRKGQVLLKEPMPATRSFTADVCILRGDGTTITKGQYETVALILHVKQTVRVVDFASLEPEKLFESDSVLRPGHSASVRFQFLKRPEYVRAGMRLVLRDGRVRGVGIIREVFP